MKYYISSDQNKGILYTTLDYLDVVFFFNVSYTSYFFKVSNSYSKKKVQTLKVAHNSVRIAQNLYDACIILEKFQFFFGKPPNALSGYLSKRDLSTESAF